MTREAQMVSDWASQFKSCAVDNVPYEIGLELRTAAHPTWSPLAQSWNSLRFRNGKYVAGLTETYAKRDDLVIMHDIEAVANYVDLLGWSFPESEISIDLTEVL